jgi:hypothetical protein
MRLQLSCHGDIDLSQPGMQVEIRSHIARCLRDYPNGGAGEQRWWNVQTENSRSLHDRRLRRTQAAGVRNRCVLRLRRQDRDRLDLAVDGAVRPIDFHRVAIGGWGRHPRRIGEAKHRLRITGCTSDGRSGHAGIE